MGLFVDHFDGNKTKPIHRVLSIKSMATKKNYFITFFCPSLQMGGVSCFLQFCDIKKINENFSKYLKNESNFYTNELRKFPNFFSHFCYQKNVHKNCPQNKNKIASLKTITIYFMKYFVNHHSYGNQTFSLHFGRSNSMPTHFFTPQPAYKKTGYIIPG